MVKQPWACKKTEDLPILISDLFHFFHQLYSTRLVCCLIGTTWCQQGLVLRRWTFQASRSSRWHSWQRITKLLRSICTRWRKRTWASLCFLLHIAIFCMPLYLREYDQYCCVTTVLLRSIAIYISYPHFWISSLREEGVVQEYEAQEHWFETRRDLYGSLFQLTDTNYCTWLFI